MVSSCFCISLFPHVCLQFLVKELRILGEVSQVWHFG